MDEYNTLLESLAKEKAELNQNIMSLSNSFAAEKQLGELES